MTTFLCTKKLLKAFRVPEGGDAPPRDSAPRLGNWYVNTIRVERRTGILYTNEKTLFSFVMIKGKRKGPEVLHLSFLHGLSMVLALEGYSDEKIKEIVSEYYTEPIFTSAKNQKILGTMIHIAKDFDYMVYYEGGLGVCDIGDITCRINEAPWSATNYASPRKLMAELTQGQAH
jgi:hypothetical protein